MGLSDFILIIDKLGFFGVILVAVFLLIQFLASIVDIYQWLQFRRRGSRIKRNREKEKLRAEILHELYEREQLKGGGKP